MRHMNQRGIRPAGGDCSKPGKRSNFSVSVTKIAQQIKIMLKIGGGGGKYLIIIKDAYLQTDDGHQGSAQSSVGG